MIELRRNIKVNGEIKNITVFGPGMMGSGIGIQFAQKGCNVVLRAREKFEEDYAVENIDRNIKDMIENDCMTVEEGELIKKNIRIIYDINEAVRDADLIFECVIEDMQVKQDLFKELDEICPENVILATNTSVMSITEIASKSVHRERIVGTHFWNPAFLIPLVEIIRTEDTSDEVVDKVYDFLKAAGKRPVKVNKDVPGFIGNRLQHALLREALYIVENGIADAATVDEAVKYGFGMRTPVLGPMEHADMVGTDLSLSIQTYLLKHLASSTEPSQILKDCVEKGDLGFKSGKGIQEWTPDEVAASKRRLNDHLLKSLKDR